MLSELQEQAKFLHESCQLEQALPIYAQLYSLALSSNQLSSELLDDYAELCTSLGNLDQSRKLYTQSIQMFPNVNSSKYFALAQICTSEESISLYTKGILLSTDQEKPQVASAYSAMAEIYMTDLCDHPQAEAKCEEFIKKALEIDDLSMDAYLSLANLRLVRADFNAAKEAMNKLRVVLENCGVDNLPSCEFLVQCGKNFIECEDFEGLNSTSEFGLGIDETHTELMYLHAFALTKLGHKEEALEILRLILDKEVTQDLREAAEEIVKSLNE